MDTEQTALQAWRQRMGWSQRRAASELGVTLSTYQTWEWERRMADGSPVEPPLTALLAASAREHGHGPVSASQ